MQCHRIGTTQMTQCYKQRTAIPIFHVLIIAVRQCAMPIFSAFEVNHSCWMQKSYDTFVDPRENMGAF